ncbi:MAG TPA: DivIVA domain-containing protein [Actinomadura sp.]|jgi:DivIVA domain-containing protein|nr:DivIVA domain-containing protein [Actinomadura sp.]
MSHFPAALRGYNRTQVDTLIQRITATAEGGSPQTPAITAAEVRASRFDLSTRGYDRRVVDEALHEHIRRLAATGPRRLRPKRPQARLAWLIGWIESVQFRGVRIRTGYDVRDVDTFLERVIAGLRGLEPPITGRDVRESLFRTVRFGPGYDEREVDAFLAQLASALDGA